VVESGALPTLAFLSPRSVAIVGASADPGKRGYQAVRRLLADGYAGEIYPVHPRLTEILGVAAYADLLAVPGAVDLALVCTPAQSLPSILEQCGRKGVKGAVILAGGFGEAGAEGCRLEAEALDLARAYGVRIVGPNTSGVFNLHRNLNLVGIPDVRPGGLGIVSQSGNMALSIVAEANAGGHLGFSTYVGVGNQMDIRFHEYLAHLGADPETEVPILYIEGFKCGRTFLDVAREVTQRKPVVVYKAGRTAAGRASAKSHTGALAGSYEMTVDLLRQAGVAVARTSDTIVPLAEALGLLPMPASNRLAILADGGGHATIAADAAVEAGLAVAELGAATRAHLATILPAAASLANPVDLAGGSDANPGVFADCAAVLLEDERIDALVIVGLFGGYHIRFSEALAPIEEETAIRLGALARRFAKPVVLQSVFAGFRPRALEIVRRAGVPVHGSIEVAIKCLAGLHEYACARRRNGQGPTRQPQASAQAGGPAIEILARCRAGNRAALYEHEALRLLAAHGIGVPAHRVIRSEDGVGAAARAFAGAPVAMKVVSEDILHKTEAGGVRLNVRGETAMREAYGGIVSGALASHPEARIEGVLVAAMAPEGVEAIVGTSRDPTFGPVAMFGLGGIFVEVLRDVAFRAIPLGRLDAADMIEAIRAREVLGGVRGAAAVDKSALADLLVRLSGLIVAHPKIEAIDLNPVIAHAQGCTVADARILLRSAGEEERP
jgi:acetyltransferase